MERLDLKYLEFARPCTKETIFFIEVGLGPALAGRTGAAGVGDANSLCKA